jgi:hypothetical protein
MDLNKVLEAAVKPAKERELPDHANINFHVTHAQKAKFDQLIQQLRLDRTKILAGAFSNLMEAMQEKAKVPQK